MKRRPIILTLYSAVLLGAAASFPTQVLYAYEIPIPKFYTVGQYLTWVNLAVIVAMVVTSIAVLRATRWALALVPLTVFLVCMNNYWVGYVGVNYNEIETTLASLAFAIVTCFLFERNSRVALLNPKSHWWQTPRRKQMERQIVLLPWNGETVTALTHDLSEAGAFVKSSQFENLAIGDRMQLRMKLASHINIRCTGRLVRKNDALGQYPAGVAVVFEDITRRERRLIRDLVYA